MHSPVYWGLLGLIINKPGYAYELAARFEHTYGGAISLASMSHMYTALDTLRDRDYIRRADSANEQNALHARRRFYEATESGVVQHARWLASQPGEERRRQNAIVAQLAASAKPPERAEQLLDEYEQACLDELAEASTSNEQLGGTAGLIARLVAEEARLTLAAKLKWVQYARAQVANAPASALPAPPPES